MQKVYNISLELNDSQIKNESILCYAGDSNAYTLQIQLFEECIPYIISDSSQVSLRYTLPNGIVDIGICTIIDPDNGIVQYLMPETMYSISGKVICSVNVQDSLSNLSWQMFTFGVAIPIGSEHSKAAEHYNNWTNKVNEQYIELSQKINSILSSEALISLDEGNILKVGTDQKLFINGIDSSITFLDTKDDLPLPEDVNPKNLYVILSDIGADIYIYDTDQEVYKNIISSVGTKFVFNSYEEAEQYAINDSSSYTAQIISIITDESNCDAYIVLPDRTLKKLGSGGGLEEGGTIGVVKHNETINRNLPNQHTVEAITGLREEIDKLSFIPDNASSSNKLITQEDNDFSIKNIKLPDLIDKDNVPEDKSFIYFENGKFTYKKELDVKRYIDLVSDKEGNEFQQVNKVQFDNLSGSIEDEKLKLKLAITTRDLPDMPKDHEHMRVLVSNYDKFIYELKLISELTHGFENYSEEIEVSDIAWVTESGGRFSRVVSHGLDSTNILATFYDENNICISLEYQIIDKASIKVYSDTKIKFRAVVNCSQGTSTQEASGVIIVDPYKFMDDNNVRVDRSYSSSKIVDLLSAYATKSTIYTQAQAQTLFAFKSSEHTHNNKSIIDRFSEDSNENLSYRGQRLITKIEPYYYERHWDKDAYDSLTEILDIKTLYNSMGYKSIVNTEFSIKNEALKSDDEIVNISNSINLVIRDGTIEELNVLILPQEVQRYTMGISPNKKIFVKGSFSANFYISAF